MTGKRHPLIVIIGPTAVGKTELAIQLARALNGEIIGADSRQIYRYMDIGTAKPTPEQRASVPHHMVDIIDPDEGLGLAQYQQQVYKVIENIHAQEKIPFLVGGTGQYVTAVIEGWSIPQVTPNKDLREELENFAALHGAEVLHKRLQTVDPHAAEKIHYRNVRRVVRALEVYYESGAPISQLQQKHAPPYKILNFGLTMERSALYARANMRVDQMMAQGFLNEVQHLLAMGYAHDLPSMSGLGYRQLSAHLQDKLPLAEAVAQTKIATQDFIRRQYTWFNGHDNQILWQNIETLSFQTLFDTCAAWLQGKQ